jgi:hypothetical protein
MKHLLRFSFLTAVIVFFAQSASALVYPVTPSVTPMTKSTEVAPKPSPFGGMTIKDFLALTPKKYKELTGKRMSLSQKLSLKIAQYKIKRKVKQNKQVDLYKFTSDFGTDDFNIGGFALGVILGPIGVLIAYLLGDQSVIKWAWIGGIIWVGIVLLVIIL